MVALRNFIFLQKFNIVFAYIPKVACPNWKCILRYLEGYSDYLNPKTAHDRKLSGLKFLSNISNGQDCLKDSKILKYTCVRNPYTRILSAYLNKVKPFGYDEVKIKQQPYFHNIFVQIDSFRKASLTEYQDVSFSCFLRWLELSEDPLTRNEHWVPQTSIIGQGEVVFDFIGRFENLQIDAPILLARMGCDIEFPSQKAIKLPPTRANELLDSYYSKNDYELVNRLYASDFQYLGYNLKNF
jgi:chondroitin 4-sulfotransferase 11/chondroitin 4-sulfotransferase 13/dermatan 4-sulfotransferase 1